MRTVTAFISGFLSVLRLACTVLLPLIRSVCGRSGWRIIWQRWNRSWRRWRSCTGTEYWIPSISAAVHPARWRRRSWTVCLRSLKVPLTLTRYRSLRWKQAGRIALTKKSWKSWRRFWSMGSSGFPLIPRPWNRKRSGWSADSIRWSRWGKLSAWHVKPGSTISIWTLFWVFRGRRKKMCVRP